MNRARPAVRDRGGIYHQRATSTGVTEWPTPQWLVDQLAAEFGPFDLDPAATAGNAKAPAYFTVDQDGLAQPWHGRVFCNPPYGKYVTPAWLAKARREVDLGHAERAVCLVPARVGTHWWRECEVDPAVFTRVIGRIRWAVDRRGEAPFDSAVIVFGAVDGRHGRYPATCANPVCPLPYRVLLLLVSSGCRGFLRSGRGASSSAVPCFVRLHPRGTCRGAGPYRGGRPGSGLPEVPVCGV